MVVDITMAVAGLAVLAAIVVVAMGRGGELSGSHPDYPRLPPTRHAIAATDVALLRLPVGLWWGYHQPLADEALARFAQVLADRDMRIAVLEQQLGEARRAAAPAAAAPPAVSAVPETAPVTSPADTTLFDEELMPEHEAEPKAEPAAEQPQEHEADE